MTADYDSWAVNDTTVIPCLWPKGAIVLDSQAFHAL